MKINTYAGTASSATLDAARTCVHIGASASWLGDDVCAKGTNVALLADADKASMGEVRPMALGQTATFIPTFGFLGDKAWSPPS